MRKLVMVLMVGACGGETSAMLDGGVHGLDAYNLDCGVNSAGELDNTTTGGALYTCATKGTPGVCTGDLHGVVQCFDECTSPPHEGLTCAGSGTPYVLTLAGGADACFCVKP